MSEEGIPPCGAVGIECCTMDRSEFDQYVEKRYRGQIKWYGDRAAFNKRLYQAFQWIVIVLSCSLPALIASLPTAYQWVTVGMAIVLAIGTAGLKAFKFQELWVSYRTLAETLKKEEYFHRAQIDDYRECNDREALFIERVESLISRENTTWVATHKQKDDKKGES